MSLSQIRSCSDCSQPPILLHVCLIPPGSSNEAVSLDCGLPQLITGSRVSQLTKLTNHISVNKPFTRKEKWIALPEVKHYWKVTQQSYLLERELQMLPDWSTTRVLVENCLLSLLVQCLFEKRRSVIKCFSLIFIRRVFFLPVAVTVGYSHRNETLNGAKVLSGIFLGILKYTLEMQTSHKTIAVLLQKCWVGEISATLSNLNPQ